MIFILEKIADGKSRLCSLGRDRSNEAWAGEILFSGQLLRRLNELSGGKELLLLRRRRAAREVLILRKPAELNQRRRS